MVNAVELTVAAEVSLLWSPAHAERYICMKEFLHPGLTSHIKVK